MGINLAFHFVGWTDLDKVQTFISEWPWMILLPLFIVSVTAEEVFFRGFLTPKLGIAISSILFAVSHAAYGSWVEIMGALILGIWLAWNFKRNQQIWSNILGHFIYNAFALFLVLMMMI